MNKASLGSIQISYPRSPVYHVREMDTGISLNIVSIIQKNLRLSRDSLETALRISLELGPCSANAAVVTESSEIVKSIPDAL